MIIINKKTGFIGCGNMGQIMIKLLINNKKIVPKNIMVYDHKLDINKKMSQTYGVISADSAKFLAQKVDILIICVKPNVILKLLHDIRGNIKKTTIVISIAVGITLDSISSVIGKEYKIIRVMPNVPLLVNQGIASITPNLLVKPQELEAVINIFETFGKIIIISEHLIHAVTGISGSAPAYVFMLIESMADAAVLSGMSRSLAYQFAAQTIKGAAQMILETGKHPGELKDMVCSPGGTTIEAVKVLEEEGFRAAVIKAVQKCIKKSKILSK